MTRVNLSSNTFGFLFFVLFGLYAQGGSGAISGIVRNQSGAAIAGAKVTLAQAKNSTTFSAVASNEGRYIFPSVKEGVYTVNVEFQGFLKVQREITVSPLKQIVMDFILSRDPLGHPPESPSTGDLNSVSFYDAPQFKQGAIDDSAQYGGHTSAGRAEASDRLLQGVAQLKGSPTAGAHSAAKAIPKDKQNSAAIEARLTQALRLNPTSFQANYNLGEFHIQQGNLVTAIPFLEKAQKIDPSHYVNSYDLALAYVQTQNLSKAREQIQMMLERKDTAELHNLLAEVEEAAGNFTVAANEYQRAAHMEPSEKHVFDWGNQLLLHKAYEPASQIFSNGVARYPGSSKMRIGMGIALYSRGQYDDAVKSLCEAVDLEPSDPRPYFFLGKMYDVSTAMADEVTRRLADFVSLHPKSALAHYYYALSLWKGQRSQDEVNLDRIESLLRSAVDLDPQLSEAHFQLGILFAAQQKPVEAIREYEMAIKFQPDFADAHYRLGQAYQRTGQKDRAKAQFEIYERLHQEKLSQSEGNRGERGLQVFTETDEGQK